MNIVSKTRSVAAAAIIALVTLLFLPSISSAEVTSSDESDAIGTMAQMLSEINHYPSAEQKGTLKAISQNESSSEAVQTIAQAIHNLEHKVQPEDANQLKEIVEGSSASKAEKQLAEILLSFNHKAGPEAQKTLEMLAN